jgi:hypothetical protein
MIDKIIDEDLKRKTINSVSKDTPTVAHFYKCALGMISKSKGDIKSDWKIICEILRKDLALRRENKLLEKQDEIE